MDEPFSRHLSEADREAIAAELERLGYTVEAPDAVPRRLADRRAARPRWLRDRADDDGLEMLGGGLDDE